jgi:excisionase family DNA binding protein
MAEAPPVLPTLRSDVMTADEAARLLRVSRWTLYAAINRGEIPHRRVGRRILFSRRALMLWLDGANPQDAGKEYENAG